MEKEIKKADDLTDAYELENMNINISKKVDANELALFLKDVLDKTIKDIEDGK